jgi:hypothetical protein
MQCGKPNCMSRRRLSKQWNPQCDEHHLGLGQHDMQGPVPRADGSRMSAAATVAVVLTRYQLGS